jgi:hypothetical protein
MPRDCSVATDSLAENHLIASVTALGQPPYLIASGLVGEPTAPVMGIAGATNMNS